MPGRNRSIESDGTVDLTRRYLSELGSYPLLTAEQEVELAKAIEAGRVAEAELPGDKVTRSPPAGPPAPIVAAAEHARRTFIQSNLRLVVSIAKRYQGTGMTLLDLIQEGNLGLMRAVEKFDHRKGFKFSTYATWWIRQSIGRGIADKGRTIRLPSHLVDTMAVLSKTSSTLLKTLGREPTAGELAEETGLPVERVRVALRAAPDLVSLSASIGDDDAELGDLLADDSAITPFDAAALSLARDDLQTLLDYLNPREREILSLRFGLQGEQPLTLDEVGQQFNVTRERIRQIEAKALTKLRHPCSARQRTVRVRPRTLITPFAHHLSAAGLGRATAWGLRAERASATRAPLVSCCSSGSASAGNQRASTISGDAGRSGRRVLPVVPDEPGRRGRPAGPSASTTTAGSPTRSTSRPTSSRTSRRAASAGYLAPLQQAARHAPAAAGRRGARAGARRRRAR